MAAITTSVLDGFFKQVYGDDVPDLVPRSTKVQKAIKFVPREKELGNKYNQPVRLSDSSGFTFAAANAGAFTLSGAAPLVTKNAQIDGAQIVLQEQMDYETAARASKGRNAFKDATSYMFEGMQKSFRRILEVELLYGQKGLGTVASVSTNALTITTAEWAPGIWAGAEGAAVEVWNAAGTTNRGNSTIASVDIEGRVVTLASAPGGTIATDVLWYKGAGTTTAGDNEMAGVHKILGNTGTLFGISASSFTLWKSASYAAGSAALSQAKLGSAIAAAVNRGLSDDLMFLVNPAAWNNLLSDQAALRRYVEKSGGKGMSFVNGADSIEFYSQNGKVSIEPSIYIKEGYAFGVSPENWLRLGASDITFKTPGFGDQIFFQLTTAAGFELRAYSHQSVFCEAPGKNVLVTGIVNS